MKKVFIIHGFEGSPNGGWRPWLMGELEKQDVYACALSMPNPEDPICADWVKEISRHVEQNNTDEIYLVGHSLGVPAILRFLENNSIPHIKGGVLVSGSCQKTDNEKVNRFFETDFNYETIQNNCGAFAIIHGDNDPLVPLSDAHTLSEKLNAELIIIKDGKHLNGGAGWFKLEECLEMLEKMFI